MRLCVCHNLPALEDQSDYPCCPATGERVSAWLIVHKDRLVGVGAVGCEGLMFDELLPDETAVGYASAKSVAWRQIHEALRAVGI